MSHGFDRASVDGRETIRAPAAGVASKVTPMSIIPLLANTSFDPEAVDILSSAFDDAWASLKASGSSFARPAYERGAREILAKRIIEMAQRGERDRAKLAASALDYLAQNYNQ